MFDIIKRSICFIIFLAVLVWAYMAVAEQKTKNINADVPVEISFLKSTEDADCILVKQGEYCILIDTGLKKDAEETVKILEEKSVTQIDYLILTHPDKDHIGGAMDILDKFPIKTVIESYYTKENDDFTSINSRLKKMNIPLIYPNRTRRFSTGEIRFIVYPPLEKQYNKDNNYSLALLISHGNINMLALGDAEEKRLIELMNIDWSGIDLYKAPYHGRYNKEAVAMIREVKPKFAVITAADSDAAIKEEFYKLGTNVFYSYEKTVEFQSDGKTLRAVGE